MSTRKVIRYEFDNYSIDAEKQQLLKNNVPVSLPPKVFQALLILIKTPKITIDKEEIYRQLWNDRFVEDSNLTQYIYILRKVLGQNSSGQPYIETVARLGYRFTAEVKTVSAEIRIEKQDEATAITDGQPKEISLNDDNEKSNSDNNDVFHENKKLKFFNRRWLLATSLLFLIIVGVGSLFYMNNPLHKPSNLERIDQIKSIAVLPFKPIGDAAEKQKLGLGIADAVITRLSKLKEIPVRPTSAVFRYTEVETNTLEIGRNLKVDAVLEGTVQQDGNLVRLTLQLINTADGNTIWSESFDGEASNIFAVQDTISAKVVNELALNLTHRKEPGTLINSTKNPAAYEAYTLGIYFWNKRTEKELRKAEQYFLKAIELDPAYAQAYAGLADTYNLLAYNRFVPLSEIGEKAKVAALKAIELDDSSAEAHIALAQVQLAYENNGKGATESLEKAIKLAPYNPTAHLRYGWRVLYAMHSDEAEHEMRLAREYDPLSPTINLALCNVLIYQRKYEEAVSTCEKSLEIDRNVPGGRNSLALGYLFLKKDDLSVATIAEEVAAYPNDFYAQGIQGYIYACAGKEREAIEISERISSQAEKIPYLYLDISLINYVLGNKEASLQNFKKAREKKAVNRDVLAYDPRLDGFRNDPVFAELMK